MKKIILVFLITTILTSCGYAPMDLSKPTTITEIEKYDESLCNYYGQGNVNMLFTLTSNQFKFRDSVGKFQVGDTITISKRNEKFKTKTQK